MPHDDHEAGFRALTAIRRIVRRVSAHSRRVGQDTGLTVPQVLVLRTILEDDADEVTGARVAERAHLSRPTVSNLVEKLVKAGLIERNRSQVDRRRVLLSLTQAGRQRLANGPPPLEQRFIDRLASLGDAEREEILQALERVVEMMDADRIDAESLPSGAGQG